MKILSFDLGRYTGWAVLEDGRLLATDEVDLGEDDHMRYANFARLYRRLAADHGPDVVAYERVVHNTGYGNHVIQACRGIVEAETGLMGLLCVPVNVMTAKKVVAGTGRATKDDMRAALVGRYGNELALITPANPKNRRKKDPQEATDAIAVGLTAASMVVAAA